MNKKILIGLIALASFSSSATDIQSKFSNSNKITDITFDYFSADYSTGDQSQHYSINASKSLNRFMFLDLGYSYNVQKENGVNNFFSEDEKKGYDLKFGLGFNYPLPLPIDLAVADLYIKGGYEKKSYDQTLFKQDPETSDEAAEYIKDNLALSFVKSSNFYVLSGIKSNFGSDDVMFNFYGGATKLNPDGKVLSDMIKNDMIDDVSIIAGADISYMLNENSSIELKTQYRYDELIVGVGMSIYIF